MNETSFSSPSWLQSLHDAVEPLTSWREASVGGAYVPTLMLVFIACVVITWLLDAGIGRLGIYRFVWHPPLFRVSLFTCLFTAASLVLFG